MSLWDRVTQALALEPWQHEPLKTLSTDEELLAEIAATRAVRQAASRPWRSASLREAMGVPAIFRAVTLISNTVGSLSMRAYRNGAELDPDSRPRLIVRPNPFTTPREFFRETAWSMAVYGEAWWWVANRDIDGQPMSLIPVNPVEIVVTQNPSDLRYPVIQWRGQRRNNADLIQIKMTGETGALRGKGPLQMCGAAVSVTVEAQEWAANFFADGGHPSIELHSDIELTSQEAQDLREAWVTTPPNMPQVTSGTLESKELATNVPSAQMIEGRDWQNGDAARMFGIPGPLLEYSIQGSSLTYQNVGQEFSKLVRQCLLPDYLEPMEQAMSDQLTRATISRFNTEGLERADMKTLYEVVKIGQDAGLFTDIDEPRAIVGLAPSVESAAVPFSPPAAIPTAIPAGTPIALNTDFRCAKCNRKLAEVAARGTRIRCRCGDLAVA